VTVVVQRGAQGPHAVVDEIGRTLVAVEVGEPEDVRHPARDPGLHRTVGRDPAGVVEPAEASGGVERAGRDVDEPCSRLLVPPRLLGAQ
jgi:hypothetical protein